MACTGSNATTNTFGLRLAPGGTPLQKKHAALTPKKLPMIRNVPLYILDPARCYSRGDTGAHCKYSIQTPPPAAALPRHRLPDRWPKTGSARCSRSWPPAGEDLPHRPRAAVLAACHQIFLAKFKSGLRTTGSVHANCFRSGRGHHAPSVKAQRAYD